MSAQHTPGRLRADGDNVFQGDTCQATHIANTNPVSDMFASPACANAARIAACWNACERIADPTVVPEAIKALRGNLETMAEQVRRLERYRISHCELDAAIAETRAVLSKVDEVSS